MLLARGHNDRHQALVFEDGWCFTCGRMLEPELGEGVRTDGVERLLAKIHITRLRLEDEARELGLTWDEFRAGPLAQRLS